MPSYLALQRHLDLKALGVAASVPYVFGFVGILLFGWLGSTVLYRVRAPMIAAGYLCAAASLYLAYTADRIEVSLAGLCGGGLLHVRRFRSLRGAGPGPCA